MKQSIHAILLCFFMLTALFVACEKREHPVKDANIVYYAQEVPNEQKTGTLFYMTIRCGHTYSECGGTCMPSPYGHVDCQGIGTNCEMSSNILVVPVSAGLYTATTQDSTDLTSAPYFNMPARSLYTGMDDTGLPRWLNIPAQFVLRDSTTRLFTFTGVFFSQQQEYKNH